MKEIRGVVLVFSFLLLSSLIGGCAVSLINPSGPNGALVIGRVVINNQHLGSGGNLPIGTIDHGIEVEIESRDGNEFIKVTTGHGGYFVVPNIPPNTYYLSRVKFEGIGSSGTDTAHITLQKSSFFTPIPGKILHVGTYSLDISENFRITVKHPISNTDAAKSFLMETYPGTPWLARQFVVGPTALGERVYSNSGKGYRVVVPPPQEWDARPGRIRVVDVRFQNKAGSGFIITGAFKKRPSLSFANVNEWWVDGISRSRGWTEIEILEERDLTLAGHSAKVVVTEFTGRRGGRRIDRTYHIYKPGGRYDLYRIRLTCEKEKYDEFLPTLEKLVKSFSFLMSR